MDHKNPNFLRAAEMLGCTVADLPDQLRVDLQGAGAAMGRVSKAKLSDSVLASMVGEWINAGWTVPAGNVIEDEDREQAALEFTRAGSDPVTHVIDDGPVDST